MVILRSRAAAVRPPRSSIAQTLITTGKAETATTRRISTAGAKTSSQVSSSNGKAAAIGKPDAAAGGTAQRRKPAAVKIEESKEAPAKSASPRKKIKIEASPAEELPLLGRDEIRHATTIDYPRLPFDLHEAVAHLKSVDVRFHSLLDSVELKPYQELEDQSVRELDLFRTLTTSILGQQVSWLAARVIIYRFCRLFHPDVLPEKPDFEQTPRESLPYPHPLEVCQADEAFLRTAGLSGAKARYVKDVARRFSDGRLDVRRIVQLDEEACIEELVQIKGVGRWTAEMLLMFALRRGNIMPVGDLGVQRGMLYFFLADKEGPKVDAKRKKNKEPTTKLQSADIPAAHDANEPVPVVEEHFTESQREVEGETHAADGSSNEHATGPMLSSNNATMLLQVATPDAIPVLPDSVTRSLLKSRHDGKKAKGNLYLTPQEMDDLTKSWHPFRSIGAYLMWALVD